MNRKILQDMLVVVPRILEALIHETRPPPPAPPTPSRPGDHAPCIRPDLTLCCAQNDEAFTRRNARFSRMVIDLSGGPRDPAGVNPQARAYMAERLGNHRT